ncbi:MAG: LuxR family transcriptional regulator [Novosphingobium sp.]|nr:LuxR family transcriptional regulator [Novosphingobium sp.]
MQQAYTLILVDADTRRRATVSHTLSGHGVHVEPFETVAELAASWPRSGTVLIHDSEGDVARLIEQMARHGEWYPIIAFADQPEAQRIVRAVQDGAVDYMVWPFDPDSLLRALEWHDGAAEGLGNARMREAVARGRIEKLTDREREVLDCVASGLSNRKIGEKLEISPRTVEIHRANMLTKLGANHTSEAIRIAIEAELVR